MCVCMNIPARLRLRRLGWRSIGGGSWSPWPIAEGRSPEPIPHQVKWPLGVQLGNRVKSQGTEVVMGWLRLVGSLKLTLSPYGPPEGPTSLLPWDVIPFPSLSPLHSPAAGGPLSCQGEGRKFWKFGLRDLHGPQTNLPPNQRTHKRAVSVCVYVYIWIWVCMCMCMYMYIWRMYMYIGGYRVAKTHRMP